MATLTASAARARIGGISAAALLAPLALLAVVLAHPAVDRGWENNPAHFWIVLVTALLNVALGAAVSVAARRRRDARLFLVSLAFLSAAGFLALHAVATPTVILGKNAGFELATPVGLALAGVFAAASGLELDGRTADRVIRAAPVLLGALAFVMGVWLADSLSKAWPLRHAVEGEQLNGWQVPLAVVGVIFYGAATAGYVRLYLRRRARILLATTIAFALLAEAMLVIVWARNWRVSWWEWHVLMVTAFLAIALSAWAEWHEERYSALYLDRTLASVRDISVLFADLTGSTSFSERHSLAEVGEMLAEYFERLVPLLEGAGGEVQALIGDEIMVVFNKDGSRAEHAVLAARAGLRLQEAAVDVASAHPDWPRFRVGVNTGEALVGLVGASRGRRQYDVLGDTVNLAARLQSEAPVDGVVIGAETARRLPEGAEVERLPDLTIKGKQAPVEAYVLHRA